jgi:hypothetical protein
MADNKLPRTAAQLADDVNHYIETNVGIRPKQFLPARQKDIGETFAKLINLRIKTNREQPDWEDEEWSAMREHAPQMYNFSYALINLVDSYIEPLERRRTA